MACGPKYEGWITLKYTHIKKMEPAAGVKGRSPLSNKGPDEKLKCGENRNHGKFKIYFLMVEL